MSKPNSSPDDNEDELFRRFAALRSPTSPSAFIAQTSPSRHIAAAATAAEDEDAELDRIANGLPLDPSKGWGGVREGKRRALRQDEDLAARLKALGGRVEVEEKEDDVDVSGIGGSADSLVEAYLATLSAPVDLEAENTTNIQQDADRILLETSGASGVKELDDERDSDDETEEQIIECAVAEAALEKETEDDPFAKISLQSAPTDLPDEADPSLTSRINLLLGLSGPSTQPGFPTVPTVPTDSKRQTGQGWNLPGWQDTRDNDLDSWCCEWFHQCG